MTYHYVRLLWLSAFLLPWIALYLLNARQRRGTWRTRRVTGLLGLTEPIFVPGYWNPPSLFDLAQSTGFDTENFRSCIPIGGVGSVLYNTVTERDLHPAPRSERHSGHRSPKVSFIAPCIVSILRGGAGPAFLQ